MEACSLVGHRIVVLEAFHPYQVTYPPKLNLNWQYLLDRKVAIPKDIAVLDSVILLYF